MRNIMVFILPLLICSPLTGQEYSNLTLDAAIEVALKSNRALLTAREDIEAAKKQVVEARSAALPKMDLIGSYTRNIKIPTIFFEFPDENGQIVQQKIAIGQKNSYSASLNFSQTLWDGAVFTGLKAAKTFVEFTDHGYRSARNAIVLNVRRFYYTALLAREIADVAKQTFEQNKLNYESVKRKFEQGVVSEFDLLRAEVEVDNSHPALIKAENAVKLALNDLKILMGVGVDSEISLAGELAFEELKNEESLGAGALENRPDLMQLKVRKTLQSQNTSALHSEFVPTLSLNGNYKFNGSSEDLQFESQERSSAFSAILQVDYPIFSGFSTTSRIQRSKIETKKIALEIQELEAAIQIQLQQARLKMEEARRRIESQQKSVNTAEKALKIANNRFNNGVGTQLEVFDTQVALSQARINRLTAIYDYLIARFEFEFAVGLPGDKALK